MDLWSLVNWKRENKLLRHLWMVNIQLQETTGKHIPPNWKRKIIIFKSILRRGYVSSQEGRSFDTKSGELFHIISDVSISQRVGWWKPSRFRTTGGMARSYVYPVVTKTKRSLTSPQAPTNPPFFFHPPQSEWRQIQPLYTKRWTPARYVFFWPLDVSFFVSDAFHHITCPISQSSSSPKKFSFFGAYGFRKPVDIVSGKHHFSLRIKPGRRAKPRKLAMKIRSSTNPGAGFPRNSTIRFWKMARKIGDEPTLLTHPTDIPQRNKKER